MNDNQVFNLMDTNGRRKDVINALQGYLVILDDLLRHQKMVWNKLPESAAEFVFYTKAIARSPDVFQKHDEYDELMQSVSTDFKKALKESDQIWFRDNFNSYLPWIDTIDKSVEARARHYTSNLVKLGLADKNRQISNVGDVLLGNIRLKKDTLEELLPLDDANITYLRQLMKLNVFDSSKKRYYSPFCMAIYLLLRKKRVSKDIFCEIVQGVSPFHDIDDYSKFVDSYEKNDVLSLWHFDVPTEIDNEKAITKRIFEKYFKNQKSNSAVEIYYDFYVALRSFLDSKSEANLDKLLTVYENNKEKLSKAFAYGNNLFKNKRGNRPSVNDFLSKEKIDLFGKPLNNTFYLRYAKSKLLDTLREYSDTTIRIFKATGLISVDNGFVELACHELCKCIFDEQTILSMISGNDNLESYEKNVNSYFFKIHSISEIMKYKNEQIMAICQSVQSKFGRAIDDIPDIVKKQRKSDFEQFIAKKYPEEVVKNLLAMFADRSNDKKIKDMVCDAATVPTIYEYIVGIAWYYFSDKTIDLLDSFNLTLSADFEPLMHAGGGEGDIVIYSNNSVIMLEVTLMNANSQKRGEWEPVLRHYVNLKTDNEDKKVTTFFIADTFDFNTINIWKAVSSVPLQSSADKSKYTENVIIMPITSNELIKFIEQKNRYNEIIQQVRALFLKDVTSFNKQWREEFLDCIM